MVQLATLFVLNQLYAGITETNLSPLHSHNVNGQDQNPKEYQALTPPLQQCCSIQSDRDTKDHTALSQALSHGHPQPGAPCYPLFPDSITISDDTSGLQSVL